jgi:hypothetical protein
VDEEQVIAGGKDRRTTVDPDDETGDTKDVAEDLRGF